MSEIDELRRSRIERLLQELKYEIEVGVTQRQLGDERLRFEFIVPISHTYPGHAGVVHCSFRVEPMNRLMAGPVEHNPRLRFQVVK